MTFTPPLTLDKAITISGFPVWDEDVKEKLNSTDPRVERTVVVNWSDRIALAKAIGGGFDPIAGIYTPPMVYAPYPWLSVIDIDPVDRIPGPNGTTNDANNIVGFAWARWKITFGRQRSNLSDPTARLLGDIQIVNRTEIDVPKGVTSGVPVPIWQFVFSGGLGNQDVDPSIPIPIKIPTATIRIVRYGCSNNGIPLSLALGGCVNAAPLFGCDPETLYFDGTVSSKQITIGGADNWTLSFDLQWKATGWNTFFNPNFPASSLRGILKAYQRVVLKSDNSITPFTLADFSPFSSFI